MRLDSRVSRLRLAEPLRISRAAMSERDAVWVRLSHNGIHGSGEVVTSPRLGLDVPAIERALAVAVEWMGDDPHPGRLSKRLPELRIRLRNALPVAAAVDSAVHDWLAVAAGVPLCELLGMPAWDRVPTAYTIGIVPAPDAGRTAARLVRAGFTTIKVKLGAADPADDIARVAAIRAAAPAAALLLDPNGAWDTDTAVAVLGRLAEFGIAAVEQPVPAGAPDELALVAKSVPIPVIADEDAGTRADLDALPGGIGGINIKLAECGGLDAALSMIDWAGRRGVAVMLGCQASTSLSIAAAAHLSGAARWVDLDGHLLITGDPWQGLGGADGLLLRPAGPGLGVQPGGER
ncbi:enolase C-terminal domain-like protein [Nocardia sp. NPDC005746]|uniref:enolase C-terminal domain-like protein n=1 Tax=Nocardia sp. NPDC005746 TaxID=3157062 RepID=UPI0033DA6353